jgi:hypothetical protein
MEADMAYTTREESLIYFDTQAEALRCMEESEHSRRFAIVYSDNFWAEHVAYGTTREYHFDLLNHLGGRSSKNLHVQLYCMDSGQYELNWYIC